VDVRVEVGAFVIVTAASGCAETLYSGEATHTQLVDRASFDLDCPRSEIKTVTLDDRTRGVSGCGKQMTYVESCDRDNFGNKENCTWVLNTDSKRLRKHDDD
jgi:hypothetical protein